MNRHKRLQVVLNITFILGTFFLIFFVGRYYFYGHILRFKPDNEKVIRLSSDWKYIVTTKNGAAYVYHTNDERQCIDSFRTNNIVCVSPDLTKIAYYDEREENASSRIYVYNFKGRDCTDSLHCEIIDPFPNASIFTDDIRVDINDFSNDIILGLFDKVLIYDLDTGSPIFSKEYSDFRIKSLAVAHKKRQFAVLLQDELTGMSAIDLIDLDNSTTNGKSRPFPTGYYHLSEHHLAFCNNDQYLAFSGTDYLESHISVYNVLDKMSCISSHKKQGDWYPCSMAFNKSNNCIALFLDSGGCIIYEIDKGDTYYYIDNSYVILSIILCLLTVCFTFLCLRYNSTKKHYKITLLITIILFLCDLTLGCYIYWKYYNFSFTNYVIRNTDKQVEEYIDSTTANKASDRSELGINHNPRVMNEGDMFIWELTHGENNKCGARGNNGKIIVPPLYDITIYNPNHGGYFFVIDNEHAGIYSIDGEYIIPTNRHYNDITKISSDNATYYDVSRNNLHGACDITGKEIIEPLYPGLVFHHGNFFVKTEDTWEALGLGLNEKNELVKSYNNNVNYNSCEFAYQQLILETVLKQDASIEQISDSGERSFKIAFEERILFDFNKYDLNDMAIDYLELVAAALSSLPSSNVHICGYTDNIGSYEANKLLSEKRALAVKQVLEDYGIVNISTEGKPLTDYVASNETDIGRAQNRRVEIIIRPK